MKKYGIKTLLPMFYGLLKLQILRNSGIFSCNINTGTAVEEHRFFVGAYRGI